ncbi:hypothetical protein FRT61_04995 [Wolbachia pipientis]|nr:hypothetical protein FRT62_05005 [Wolbachia pipientis]QED00326.1 hypothetical protein FRT63_05015 [Wolbachia pipientis]QED01455.1 hypothetical protein FRT61_04995 [Wolbachia pipientis]
MLKFIDRDLWSKSSPDIAKNLLDKPCQSPYHETEAIYLSSLYRLNDKKTHVSGVPCLIFCTMCILCLYKISRFLPNIS